MTAAIRLQRRRGRTDSGEALLEGPHLVAAAVAAGATLRRVFALAEDAAGRGLATDCGAELFVVDEATLGRLATTKTPQSPVAVLAIPEGGVEPGGRVVVAWGVSDPGNCGTLIRLGAAFGYGYLAGPGSADIWSPKVLRAASGAHFATPVGAVSRLEEARAGGRVLVATVVSGGEAPGPLPPEAAVVVGSEAHGLPEDVVAACDRTITIPTTGAVESLNAATAAAIVLHAGAMTPGTNLSRP